jgi:hypothetical protein
MELPPHATEEEKALWEYENDIDWQARRDQTYATLRQTVASQRRVPRLAAVRELFEQRAAAVKVAEGYPERVPTKTIEALREVVESGGRQRYDIAGKVSDIIIALALNADCMALFESLPALVTEALGENVARLRGQLFRDNVSLGERRFALEGRTRNPTVRALVVAKTWEHLLTTARGG